MPTERAVTYDDGRGDKSDLEETRDELLKDRLDAVLGCGLRIHAEHAEEAL